MRTPRSKRPETRREYDAQVETTASDLIARVVLPGEWFLVRFGGTRKGSGTFYTRPQLAVPTVQRTLRPLAYNPPLTSHGQPDETIPATDWIPKPPEEILRLKVCDQGMGSGSFVIATLRFLTEALLESLYEHGRIQRQEDQILITLAAGEASGGQLNEEYLKCRPDDEDFESLLRAQLKRYIVERCLYGVDLDPLAVELARLAVWIETMDKALPFEFLDHKLKVGNALVQAVADEHRFFHWELEFPDVFAAPGNGFDAVVGKPPWEIQKPNSKEFLSNLDPLYRAYGKQEALAKQREYFQRDIKDERDWVAYNARFKALANWNKHAAFPFGDGVEGGKRFSLGPGSNSVHARWRERRVSRQGYADPYHPFGLLSSFVYDAQMRVRLGGLTLNYCIVAETAIIRVDFESLVRISSIARSLSYGHNVFAPFWLMATRERPAIQSHLWRRLWALTPYERLRLRCLLDAITAELYGLNYEDLSWILRDCDYPLEHLRDLAFTRTLDPKDLWRVDKGQDPELRHAVLTLAAFRDLKDMIAACGGDRDRGKEFIRVNRGRLDVFSHEGCGTIAEDSETFQS